MKPVIIIERIKKTPHFIKDLSECKRLLKSKINNITNIEDRIKEAKNIKTNTNDAVWQKCLLLNELQYDLVSEEEDIERLRKAIDEGEKK